MLLILDDIVSSGVNMKTGLIANLYTSLRHADISVITIL